MKKDKFYHEIMPIYNAVVEKYTELISEFSFEILSINDYEKVFVVEDSFIVYIGLKEFYPEDTAEEKEHHYLFFKKRLSALYRIQIEELTPNNLFKFVGTKFSRYFSEHYGTNEYYFFRILRFYGIKNRSPQSVYEYVNRKIPSLRFDKRYEQWTGNLYYFIIYELTDFNGDRAFCVWNTTRSDLDKIALQKCKEVEHLIIMRFKQIDFESDFIFYDNNIAYNDHFRNTAYSIIQHLRRGRKSWNLKELSQALQEYLKYMIVEKYIKESEDFLSISNDLYNRAIQGEFDNLEKGAYTLPPTKWKSEFLVKQICEKLYGANNVIFQHKPFFLHHPKGQLSYDVYLTKERIAIEYQGKQHFEPVDYFGGKESFEKQKERDALKLKLSEENNVKLIYINYWDPLTKEFISNKVNEIKGNTNSS